MLPLLHLYAIVAITLLAYGLTRYDRSRRRKQLQRVAGELELTYAANDPFRLAGRIVDAFPVPGAARLVVTDVLYGTRGGDNFLYLFTVHYTIGAVRVKKRLYRVSTFVEPLAGPPSQTGIQRISVAPDKLAWLDQYRELAKSELPDGNLLSAAMGRALDAAASGGRRTE
jgi:hypothetical protein